jgi:xanthine dehydrogenase YagT iron-sulfur-binding subunit
LPFSSERHSDAEAVEFFRRNFCRFFNPFLLEATVDDLPDKKSKKSKSKKSSGSDVSRRDFLKISGVSAAVPLLAQAAVFTAGAEEVPTQGPGKVPVALTINGKKYRAQLEPRVTLLDALRDSFELTGAKRVCDRGTCGACTVFTTVEGLGEPGNLHPIQQAFVDNDGQQCGFCTPGFVVACKAFLDQHPNPTPEQIKHGLGGNFCRCGTYAGIKAAIAQVAGTKGA